MGRTLLLVDDEQNIISSLVRLLRRDGYNILRANSGKEGLQLLLQNKVGVIITDQRMPEMTGVEFLSQVKELYPDTMRIVLTGYTELSSVTDAINRGAVYRFLTKPCEDELLRSNVDEAFRLYEMKMENARLHSELQLAAHVFVNSAEAIVITDSNNNILRVNQSFTTITGYSLEEVVGKNPRVLNSGLQGADFYREMWSTLLATGCWQGEIMDSKKSGEIYPKWLSIALVRDEQGAISNFIALFSDITARRASFDRVQHLANYDALTNLPNRILLNDRVESAIATAKRNKSKLGILFIDLDRFKNVNDTMGHHVGDILLQAVAARLQTCVRESDTVARLGGDEFVILLSNINDEKDADLVAQKIIDLIGKPFILGEYQANIGASIGGSIYPIHGADRVTLLKNADTAMYTAKEKGRNNFQFFA